MLLPRRLVPLFPVFPQPFFANMFAHAFSDPHLRGLS
jgi:hypothetical protein